jgi:adenine-specific DNA-methyltransferase
MTPTESPVSSFSRPRERARVRARELRSASTDAERLLWSRLRDRRLRGHKFLRQHPVDRFFADFACLEAKLIVELDGGQHYDDPARAADDRRTLALVAQGFQVLRFSNRDVLTGCEAVLGRILEALAARDPHPNPLPQAGEGERRKDVP